MGDICSKELSEPDFRESYNSDIRSAIQKRVPKRPGLIPKQEEFIRFHEQRSLFVCKETRVFKDLPVDSFMRDPEFSSLTSKFQNSGLRIFLCAVLLSKGNIKEKAQLLIRVFNFERQFSLENIKSVLILCFEVAVDVCPLLAYELCSSDSIKEREIINYRNILRTQKENFVSQVIKDIQVTDKDSFEALLCNSELRFILQPQKLRERILNNYISIP